MRGKIGYGIGLAAMAILANGVVAQQGKPAKGDAAASKAVAVANGVTITMAEVDSLIKARGPLPPETTEAQRKQIKRIALDKLIDDVVLEQFLQKNAPRLPQEELNKRLAEMETALKKEGKTLADLSKETGQSEQQMRRNAMNGLLLEGYIKSRVKEADLKRYYNENKDFFDGALVKASHIAVRLTPTAADADRTAAREKLLKIRQDIVAKKISFADAAKKFSESETSSRGGDLGFFARKGTVEEAFAKAAYALEVNQISDVVATELAMHLIMVTERKPGQPSDYEKTKNAVHDFYVDDMIQNALTEQRKKLKITINLP
ncbi:MAG: peptidylprolyl isomerase [Gemmataceae bacterium]